MLLMLHLSCSVMKRAAALAVAVSAIGPASAFDAGPHQDLMQSAMDRLAFSPDAIGAARINNWMVDYYSNIGAFQAQLGRLHFDNLPTTHNVKVYWGKLTDNTRRALQRAAIANDPYKALSLLGMSLHAVQDFYTHSTWVETHPRTGGFRAETYFTNPPTDDIRPNRGVYTGRYPNSGSNAAVYHGSYFWGVNHDNYNRPKNDEAIVFAYSATVQWIRAAAEWVESVKPGFFLQMTSFSDPTNRAVMTRDLGYSYYISLWIKAPETRFTPLADGRWKAFGSGDYVNYANTQVSWFDTPPDNFTMNFDAPRFWFSELTPGLDNVDGLIPAIPPLPRPDLFRRAIIVRTLRVRDDTWTGIDTTSKADFFAALTIAGQTIVEPTAQDVADLSPLWNTIRFVPSSSVNIPISYTLWEEDVSFDGTVNGTNDLCDINPARGRFGLNFRFNVSTHNNTGDVRGVFDSPSSVFTSSGNEGNQSSIWFYVTELPVIEP